MKALTRSSTVVSFGSPSHIRPGFAARSVVASARGRLAFNDTLMVRIYLTDFSDYGAFNAAYAGWFTGPLPARTTVGVTGLAVGARVEIDLITGLAETP